MALSTGDGSFPTMDMTIDLYIGSLVAMAANFSQ